VGASESEAPDGFLDVEDDVNVFIDSMPRVMINR